MFSLWATPFTDAVSAISAAFLNKVRTELARAIDSDGGTYAPSTPIEIGGSGLKLSGSGNIILAARTISRWQSMAGAESLSSHWERYTTPALGWRNITAAGGALWVPLTRLPHGGTLATVTVRFKGGAGHAAFPGGAPTMPTIQVIKVDQDGTETALAAATSDTSATAGAYEVAHDITTGSLAHTIDLTTYRYHVEIITETGGNWATGSLVLGCKTACSCVGYSEY